MEIIKLRLDQLKPYEKNAKRHTDEQIQHIINSIEQFGMNDPIGIWGEKNVIVEGHGRYFALKKMGIKDVDCIRLDHLSDEERKAYTLVHNQATLETPFDDDLLNIELDGILDIDMAEFGFDLDFEDENGEPNEIEEDNVTEDVDSRCHIGDLWQLGAHRLICGDSTDVTVIDRLMDGVKADMMFTDPPYNLETEGGKNGPIGKSLAKQGESIAFIADFEPTEFLNVLPSIFNGNMNAYVFCNKDLLPEYLTWAKNNEYSFNVLIWKKPSAIPINAAHYPDIEYLLFFRKNAIWNPSIEDVNYSRCLEYSRVTKTKENGKHPTIKPVELIANELKISSNKDSVVVDLFGGSGSTLIACEQTGRRCFMAELSEHYCDVIINRWEQLTGKQAVLLSDKEET